MKIYFAADHAGFDLKNALLEHVRALGHEVEDLGAYSLAPEDDYPDVVTALARRVAAECREVVLPTSDVGSTTSHMGGAFGIALGGSGQGEAMCANRVPGVRAAVFYGPVQVTEALDIEGGRSEDGYDAVRLPRRHNNANVLCIGSRFVSGHEADEAVRIFLNTPFSDSPRHARRLAKF